MIPWEDIESLPEYQALPDWQKASKKQAYWQRFVEPSEAFQGLTPDMRRSKRDNFLGGLPSQPQISTDTTPEPSGFGRLIGGNGGLTSADKAQAVVQLTPESPPSVRMRIGGAIEAGQNVAKQFHVKGAIGGAAYDLAKFPSDVLMGIGQIASKVESRDLSKVRDYVPTMQERFARKEATTAGLPFDEEAFRAEERASRVKKAEKVTAFGKVGTDYYKKKAEDSPEIQAFKEAAAKDEESIWTQAIGAAGSLAGAVVTTLVVPGIGPLAAGAGFFNLNKEEAYEAAKAKLIEKGVDSETADKRAEQVSWTAGIVNSLLDTVGAGRIANVFKPAKRLLNFLTGALFTSQIEGGTEAVQSIVTKITSEYAAKDKGESQEDFISRMVSNLPQYAKEAKADYLIGTILGGGAHVIGSGAPTVAGIVKDREKKPAPTKPDPRMAALKKMLDSGEATRQDLEAMRKGMPDSPVAQEIKKILEQLPEKEDKAKKVETGEPIELTDIVQQPIGLTGIPEPTEKQAGESAQIFEDERARDERMRQSPEGAKLLKEQLTEEQTGKKTAFQELVDKLRGNRVRFRKRKLTDKQIEDQEFDEWSKKAQWKQVSDEEFAEAKRFLDRLEEDKAFRDWYLASQKTYAEPTEPPTIAKPEEPTPTMPLGEEVAPRGVGGVEKGEFPAIKDNMVDGREVGKDIPNTTSIQASLTDYEELSGIREISMGDIETTDPKDLFYAADDRQIVRDLTAKIKKSGKIDPLIVVQDDKGLYILEGGHRLGALHELGATSFPALVVKDLSPKEPEVEGVKRPVVEKPTIPDFKSTEEALAFGEKATPEQQELLRQRREGTAKRAKELMEADKLGESLIEGTKAQFDREALEVAPKEKPPTEPKVTPKEPEVEAGEGVVSDVGKEAKEPWEMGMGEFEDVSEMQRPQKWGVKLALKDKTSGKVYIGKEGEIHTDMFHREKIPLDDEGIKSGFVLPDGTFFTRWETGKEGKARIKTDEGFKYFNRGYKRDLHKKLVQQAIDEGKIKSHPDYPDLKPKKAKPVEGEKAPKAKEGEKAEQDIEVKETPKGTVVKADLTKKEGEALTLKQQKAYLLAEIDKAIEVAPEEIGWNDPKVHVKIEVPGDGTFKVLNSVKTLSGFRESAKARFPTGRKPPKTRVTQPTPEMDDRVDLAIDTYGDAANAAEKIKGQIKDLDFPKAEAKWHRTLVIELESRARYTSKPEDQKSDRFAKVKEQVDSETYEREQSEIMKAKHERRVQAVKAIKAHPQFKELANLVKKHNDFGKIDKETTTQAIKDDGDLLNYGGEPYSSTHKRLTKHNGAIKKLQKQIAGDLGIYYNKGDNNYDLSSYWKDMAVEYEAEPTKPTGEEPRYQEYEEDLISYHNTTETELLSALESGGLAVPSIAITQKDIQFDKYGEITLVGKRGLVDPAEYGNRVFDSDIYSPRVPGKEWTFNGKQGDAVFTRFESVMDEVDEYKWSFNEDIKKGRESFIDYADRSSALKVAFLRENDISVRIPKRPVPLRFAFSDVKAVSDYLKSYEGSIHNIEFQSKEHKKLSEIVEKAVTEKYDKNDLTPYMKRHYFGEDGFLHYNVLSQIADDATTIKENRTEVDKHRLEDNVKRKFTKKLADQYLDWINEIADPMYSEPFIKLGRKKVPYTLNNIVQAIKNEGLKAKEKTLVFGPGSARASAAKEITSIKGLHKIKSRLVSGEELSKAKELQEKEREAFTDRLIGKYKHKNWRGDVDVWNALDDAMRSIGAFLSGKNRSVQRMQSILYRNGFENVSDALARKAIRFANILMDTPTQYFEAKPQRAVDFSEFAGVVIPTKASKKLKTALANAGLQVKTYKKYDAESRHKAISGFHKKPDVLFSLLSEDAMAESRESHRQAQIPEGTKLGVNVKALENIVKRLKKNWNNAPEFVIVEKQSDLPKELNKPGRVITGVYHKNKVYLVAGNMPSMAFSRKTIAHETLGHHGFAVLRQIPEIGAKLDAFMDRLYKTEQEAIDTIAANRNYDINSSQGRMLAGEEWLAYKSETDPKNTWVKQAIALIRQWIAKTFPNLKVSRAEISTWLGQMQRAVVEGEGVSDVGGTRYQTRTLSQPFFSQLIKSVEENIKQMPAKVQSITKWLQKKQVKPAELKWMGVETWMSENQKNGKIDRDAFLEFLKSNDIEVREVVKGKPVDAAFQRKIEERADELHQDRVNEEIERLENNGYVEGEDFDPVDISNEMDWQESYEKANFELAEIDETKYSQYQLPGGEAYREMVFVLPEKPTQRDEFYFDKLPNNEWGIFKDGAWFTLVTEEITPESKAILNDLNDSANKRQRREQSYQSPHYDEANVLAHVRWNERTDADGNRVLFVEEVQSDWLQEAKEKGFTEPTKKPTSLPEGWEISQPEPDKFPYAYTLHDAEGNRVGPERWGSTNMEEAIKHAIDYFHPQSIPHKERGVPPAPFLDNWHEYVMKRVLRMAAEQGFDAVAWTKGKHQIDRYEHKLRKSVDEIQWDKGTTYKTSKDVYIVAQKDGGKVFSELVPLKGTTTIAGQEVTLKDVVGKPIAQQIIASTQRTGTVKGDDLSIGGMGMRSFYDELIPGFLKKYGKQWNAEVSTTDLDIGQYEIQETGMGKYRIVRGDGHVIEDETGDYKRFATEEAAQQYIDNEFKGESVHSIPITESMRESVLFKGQARWQMAPEQTPDQMLDEFIEKWSTKGKGKEAEKEHKATRDKKIKSADTLFRRGKKALSTRFGKQYIDRDMKWYHAAFGAPYWLGKEFKSLGKAVDVEIAAAETRSAELFKDYEGNLGDLQNDLPKNKEAMEEVKALIWKWDGKRMPKKAVPDDWFIEPKEDEDLKLNPKHYKQVHDYLKKQGHSDKAIKGFLIIRHKLDEKWIDIDKTMRVEQLDPELITQYRSQINKIHNYFPHRRTGGSHVTIIKKKAKGVDSRVVYREHYNTLKDRALPIKSKTRSKASQWLDSQIKSGKLEGSRKDYKVISGKVTQLPDEVFFQVPVEAMQQLVAEAGRNLERYRAGYEAKRLFNKEGKTPEEALELAKSRLHGDLEDALSKAVAEVFKGRGWGRHAILREGIPGHETEDVFGILFDYLSGYAGFKTKIVRTRQHHDIIAEVNAKKQEHEYKYLSGYIKDMLANQDKVDRAVDTLRGLFFAKYLGGVIKSGMVNLTQNVVLAAPTLSVHTKGSTFKLSKAMLDTRRALTSKAAWTGKEVEYKGITKDERKALHDLIEAGTTQDLFLRELKGDMPGVGMAKYYKKAIDKAGIFMQIAEKFNRASTGLAAYRVGVKEKGMSYDEALKFAKKVVYDSHFLYGQSNLPAAMRGGTPQKLMRSAYTFRSFTHNYLSAITHLFANQQKAAVARSLRNILLVGGLTSLPFFKLLSDALYWAFGKDEDDPMTDIREVMPNEWVKDMVTYGLPGVLGGDLTGSISIEFPRNWADIVGVPYSIGEDVINTIKALKSGSTYRAISGSPITPIVVRNAMRGAELYLEGQRTRSGRDINYPGEPGPKKITAKEAIQKGVIGLQPTSVSKGYASYQAISNMEKSIQEKKTAWADQFVNAFRSGDKAKMQAIIKKQNNWNLKAGKQKKAWKGIDITKSVNRRLETGGLIGIPQLMRKRALEIAKQWKGTPKKTAVNE